MVAAALYYLAAYAFTNFAAWSVVVALEKAGEAGLELDDYAGMGRKHPALGGGNGGRDAVVHRDTTNTGVCWKILPCSAL